LFNSFRGFIFASYEGLFIVDSCRNSLGLAHKVLFPLKGFQHLFLGALGISLGGLIIFDNLQLIIELNGFFAPLSVCL
jgi:hypothetical protein